MSIGHWWYNYAWTSVGYMICIEIECVCVCVCVRVRVCGSVSLTSHARVAVHQNIRLPTKLHVDEQWQKGKNEGKDQQHKNLWGRGRCRELKSRGLWLIYLHLPVQGNPRVWLNHTWTQILGTGRPGGRHSPWPRDWSPWTCTPPQYSETWAVLAEQVCMYVCMYVCITWLHVWSLKREQAMFTNRQREKMMYKVS